jgi:hypothetical protein
MFVYWLQGNWSCKNEEEVKEVNQYMISLEERQGRVTR